MKLILSFSISLLSWFYVNAQYSPKKETEPTPPASSTVYFVPSSGINNYAGILGLGLQVPVNNRYSLRGGAGLGAWGFKLGVAGKFERLDGNGFGLGLGYAFATGIRDFTYSREDELGNTLITELDLKPVGVISCTGNYNFRIWRRHFFYLEGGWGFKTVGSRVSDSVKIKGGDPFDEEDELVFAILRPGGIILGAGFLIGI